MDRFSKSDRDGAAGRRKGSNNNQSSSSNHSRREDYAHQNSWLSDDNYESNKSDGDNGTGDSEGNWNTNGSNNDNNYWNDADYENQGGSDRSESGGRNGREGNGRSNNVRDNNDENNRKDYGNRSGSDRSDGGRRTEREGNRRENNARGNDDNNRKGARRNNDNDRRDNGNRNGSDRNEGGNRMERENNRKENNSRDNNDNNRNENDRKNDGNRSRSRSRSNSRYRTEGGGRKEREGNERENNSRSNECNDKNDRGGSNRRNEDGGRRGNGRENNSRDNNRNSSGGKDENDRKDNRNRGGNDGRDGGGRKGDDSNRRDYNKRENNSENDSEGDDLQKKVEFHIPPEDTNEESNEEVMRKDSGRRGNGRENNSRDNNRNSAGGKDENDRKDYRNRGGNDGRDGGGRRGREDNDRGDDNKRENNSENDSEGDDLPKKVEFYIPPEHNNDESTVFSSGITTGINFNKFDDIKVEMTGNNLPEVISSFEDINLNPLLLNNIKKSNYTKPTPIQKYAISVLMAQRDLMACAQTGSGKTAAFLIPILDSFLKSPADLIKDEEHTEPQALIVSPTRELAIQIYHEARKFSFDSNIQVSLIYGGVAVGYQRRCVDNGSHIMIATPGRLLHFVEKGWVTFNSIRFLVLDEADRMLSMGFMPSMQEVFHHPTMVPPEQRRTLMFSATFPQDIQNLATEFLNDYIFVTVGIVGSASSDVEQIFIQVEQSDKRPKLVEVFNKYGTAGSLVFVETKRNADFLAIYLSEQNYKINSIHGDRCQREREEAISDFKTGKCDILVATSVAARGLDIQNVKHVINFDLPAEIDDYVHRVGRTGRIGNKGKATSFYDQETNSRNAEEYAKILEQSKQNVPDWLLSRRTNKSNNYTRPSFGGRDGRRDRRDQPPRPPRR